MNRLARLRLAWQASRNPIAEPRGVLFVTVPDCLRDDDLLQVADAFHHAWPELSTEQQRLAFAIERGLQDQVASRYQQWITRYADTVAAWERE